MRARAITPRRTDIRDMAVIKPVALAVVIKPVALAAAIKPVALAAAIKEAVLAVVTEAEVTDRRVRSLGLRLP